jgi:glycine/D-amino acid oxidase-like deaminating enzyme
MGRSRGFYESFWKATAAPGPECPRLAKDERAEAVVIGAGYTGLSAALRIAEAGRDVRVLELEEPGFGASGRTTGWWVANYQFLTPSQAIRRFGETDGERIIRLMVDAGRLVPQLIERYGIDCDMQEKGVVYAARTEERFAELSELASEWRTHGGDVRTIDSIEIRKYIASDVYLGGILFAASGMMHPLNLTRGLAAAAVRAGARIHARSPAIGITRAGDEWLVETPGGTVRAKHVLIATNAFRHKLINLRRTFLSIRIGMIVSAPFADAGRQYLPLNVPYTDTSTGDGFAPGFGFQGRIITSMFPNFLGSDDPQRVGGAFWRKFRRVFPAAPASVRWDYAWHGHVCVPSDRLVKVVEMAPRLIAAYGYSGAGIAQSLMVGQETADWILTGDRTRLRIPPMVPKRILFPGLLSGAINRVGLPAVSALIYR